MGPVVTEHCPLLVSVLSCENLRIRSLEGVTRVATGKYLDHVEKIQGCDRQ